MQGYTAETVIVGRALQKDFEQRGVHLDAHGQSKALQMSQQIAVMGMQIGQSGLSAMIACLCIAWQVIFSMQKLLSSVVFEEFCDDEDHIGDG